MACERGHAPGIDIDPMAPSFPYVPERATRIPDVKQTCRTNQRAERPIQRRIGIRLTSRVAVWADGNRRWRLPEARGGRAEVRRPTQ
jgi:hypothetical protein